MSILRSGTTVITAFTSVQFTFDSGAQRFESHWSPGLPKRLSDSEWTLYRRVRDEFLQHVAEQVGGPVAVVEL